MAEGQRDVWNELLVRARGFVEAGAYLTRQGIEVPLEGPPLERHYYACRRHEARPGSYSSTAHFVRADPVETALFLRERKGVNPVVVVEKGDDPQDSLEAQLGRRSTFAPQEEPEEFLEVRRHFGLLCPDSQRRVIALMCACKRRGVPRDVALQMASHMQGNAAQDAVCVVKNVLVFAKGEDKAHVPLDRPQPMSFIVAKPPALGAPGQDVPREASEHLFDLLSTILHAAVENEYDAIVFPPFGCGNAHFSPELVAEMVRTLVIHSSFNNSFKHITFAFPRRRHGFGGHNPEANLPAFQAVFTGTGAGRDKKRAKECALQ